MYIHICIYTYLHIHIYIYIFTHTYLHKYVCLEIYLYLFIYLFIYIYIYLYIYILYYILYIYNIIYSIYTYTYLWIYVFWNVVYDIFASENACKKDTVVGDWSPWPGPFADDLWHSAAWLVRPGGSWLGCGRGKPWLFPWDVAFFCFFPFNSHLVPILNAIQWRSGMLWYEFREWNITQKPKSKGLSRAMIVYRWLPGLFAENAEFASHDIRMKNLRFNQCLFEILLYPIIDEYIILCRTSITSCRLLAIELWNITIELWLRPTFPGEQQPYFFGVPGDDPCIGVHLRQLLLDGEPLPSLTLERVDGDGWGMVTPG